MMRTRTVIVFASVFVLLSGIARAETLPFPEHNFAIDLPGDWRKTDAPAPALVAIKNADGQKVFVIVATRIPDNERDTGVASMSHGAKESTKAKGWTISGERKVSINGITFETFNSQVPNASATITTWMTLAGNEAYALQAIHKSGNAENDAELRSIMNSFRLLSPAEVNVPAYDKTSVAYRIGRLVGGPCACVFLLGLLVVAGLGIVWLVRRRKAN
jgi:predicted Zn-dependent protease